MVELWKDIEGYEGIYQVSSFGRLKSLAREIKRKSNNNYFQKEKILNPSKTKKGYLFVTIYNNNGVKKSHQVHRIVARAFIENSNNKICVNHIDNIKNNNFINNLEWVTNKENTKHYFKGFHEYKKTHYHELKYGASLKKLAPAKA